MILEKEKSLNQSPFYSHTKEYAVNNPQITGNIPDWLNGNLLRTSSANFDFKDSSYKHWFDGLCLLYSFSFDQGKVSYQSKFLQSDDYIQATQNDKVVYSSFGTGVNRSLFKKLKDIIKPTKNYKPNANVNITRINNDFVAMTEIPAYVKFSEKDLSTLDLFNFNDEIKAQVTTAHPHFDFKTNEFYNMAISFSATSNYIFYKMKHGSDKREIVAQISTKSPCYVHSFGMTENYLIFAECPLEVNPLNLIFSNNPFIENYKWNPENGSKFHIIEKSTGKYRTIETESFFSFHNINAFELNNQIILDLVAFDDSKIINSFYLDKLNNNEKLPNSRFKRFTFDLNKSTVKSESVYDISVELPRINYKKNNTKEYNYVYMNSQSDQYSFLNQIVMMDINKRSVKTWEEENCYPGEPVFVEKPNSIKENDGVILSVVMNTKNKESFLLILDANNFSEFARINVGHSIPLGFHGQFFKV